MKFKKFDDLIRNEVLGGNEDEYYDMHRDRIYKTLQAIPETAGKNVLDLGCEPGYIAIALKVIGYNIRGGECGLN